MDLVDVHRESTGGIEPPGAVRAPAARTRSGQLPEMPVQVLDPYLKCFAFWCCSKTVAKLGQRVLPLPRARLDVPLSSSNVRSQYQHQLKAELFFFFAILPRLVGGRGWAARPFPGGRGRNLEVSHRARKRAIHH